MRTLLNPALRFVAIGIVLYGLLGYAAERLTLAVGHSNPIFKILAASEVNYDWVILGASHAMPLDFDGFGARLERETGHRILNLGSLGTGPLYNRFVLDVFLRKHRAGSLLYIVDAFSFRSSAWNEERFSDVKLVRGAPLDRDVASLLLRYVREDGVPAYAALDYLTLFSKINNRDRFVQDTWEGERQFDRIYRASPAMVRKRIDYLYPEPPNRVISERYLASFEALIDAARQRGMTVTVVRMPLPPDFRRALPDESSFDAELARRLAQRGTPFHDFASALDDPRYFFDTDHLNRQGAEAFLDCCLRPILAPGRPQAVQAR